MGRAWTMGGRVLRAACVLALMSACASTAGPERRAAPRSGDVELLAGAEDPPAQGQPCRGGECAPGLTCLSYLGVAGPRGPSFSSCEIPCAAAGAVCPAGQACVTVADGPGRVCREDR